jgi:hypothetical protein
LIEAGLGASNTPNIGEALDIGALFIFLPLEFLMLLLLAYFFDRVKNFKI